MSEDEFKNLLREFSNACVDLSKISDRNICMTKAEVLDIIERMSASERKILNAFRELKNDGSTMAD